MGLRLVGVLPVSAFNIGLTAGIAALQVQISQLQVDLANLELALAAQAEVSFNLPDLTALTASIAAQLAALPSILLPANLVTGGATANADLAVQLGLIEAKIAVVGPVAANFEAGLNTGSLALWTYSGSAEGFGRSLEAKTAGGWGTVKSDSSVQAVIIGTESFKNWGTFSGSFNTGTTAMVAATTDKQDLRFQGILTGAQINTGVLSLFETINLFLLQLNGIRANLLYQLDVSLGLNLPDVGALVASLEAILPNVALDNLVNVKTDIAAEIGAITIRIGVILNLAASLNATLSAGGFAVWLYDGPVLGMGSALRTATAGGIPSGSGPGTPAYGVVVASELPSAWASFGLIFLTR